MESHPAIPRAWGPTSHPEEQEPQRPLRWEGKDCLLRQRTGEDARRKRSRLGKNLRKERGAHCWRAGW